MSKDKTKSESSQSDKPENQPLPSPTPSLNRFGVDMSKVIADGKRQKTVSLFVETNRYDDDAQYTLGCNPTKVSFLKVYLDIGDPTEYEFAMQALGSWDHWVTLTECKWFQPHLKVMRDTLSAKLRSEAIRRLKVKAAEGDSKVNTWLAKEGWLEGTEQPQEKKSKRTRGKGTSSNEVLSTGHSDALADAARLGLKLVK